MKQNLPAHSEQYAIRQTAYMGVQSVIGSAKKQESHSVFVRMAFLYYLKALYGFAGAGAGLGAGAGAGVEAVVPSSALRVEIVSMLLSPD